jgi:hypothetical protein
LLAWLIIDINKFKYKYSVYYLMVRRLVVILCMFALMLGLTSCTYLCEGGITGMAVADGGSSSGGTEVVVKEVIVEKSPPDADNDNIQDNLDNCPTKSNENQRDTDDDGKGDVCDNDDDNDGIYDPDDNCPKHKNMNQYDTDNDDIGDMCDNPECGNGVLDSGEICDDDEWADPVECKDFGFEGGPIKCNRFCDVDTTRCCYSTEGVWNWGICTKECGGGEQVGFCTNPKENPCGVMCTTVAGNQVGEGWNDTRLCNLNPCKLEECDDCKIDSDCDTGLECIDNYCTDPKSMEPFGISPEQVHEYYPFKLTSITGECQDDGPVLFRTYYFADFTGSASFYCSNEDYLINKSPMVGGQVDLIKYDPKMFTPVGYEIVKHPCED